jgi:hypothetical protein
LALPLVVLSALAYLGSAAHFTLVQHSTCLEHGEVVHGEVEQGHASEGMHASFDDERLARTDAAPVSVHGVEAHCAHTFFRRVTAPPAGATLAEVQQRPSGPVLLTADAQVEPPVGRLFLAPKSSPPRV